MEVTKVMHMNGGDGKTSYASNSLLQRKAISMTQPIIEAAITALYSSILATMTTSKLVIAELGCSSGPNTFFAVREIIKLVKELSKKKQQISQKEYQIFLNDLPGNDFNTIFRSLPESDDQILGDGCFFTGVAGSFYTRLFPQNTLHFVHSANSLHWLSQVPKGVEANKGHIYIASTSTTPASVLEAYYKQFKDDFSTFLKCRAQEVVPNGRMVLSFVGRKFEDPATGGLCLMWELLAMAINEMVTQGVIEEEKMDGFNLPTYFPSEAEVKEEVLKQGSFLIESLEFSEVNWSGYDDSDYENGGYSTTEEAYVVARCMRSVTESMIIDHFGEAVVEDVFHKYYLLIADRLSKEKPKIVCLIASLVRTSE